VLTVEPQSREVARNYKFYNITQFGTTTDLKGAQELLGWPNMT